MVEAPTGDPLLPPNWSEISTMTISYGHGLSSSPVHLATAYSSLLNGGYRVTPTLQRQDGPQYGDRVVSETVSATARQMLRAVVDRGTASFGDVEGYEVGGKTGTADKPRPTGGYYDDRTIATFASVFPADDPQYVLIVTLDEPSVEALGEQRDLKLIEVGYEQPSRTENIVPAGLGIARAVRPRSPDKWSCR